MILQGEVMTNAEGNEEPELDPSAPTPRSPSGGRGKTVVFVAPPGTVSRALTCAIEAEFPWLSAVCVPEVNAVPDGIDAQLIVLAHQVFRSDRAKMAEIAGVHRRAGLAIMADMSGHPAFHDLPEDLPVRGVLPMDVNLDIWLSILRIMLHGGTYIAPDLFARDAPTAGAQEAPGGSRRGVAARSTARTASAESQNVYGRSPEAGQSGEARGMEAQPPGAVGEDPDRRGKSPGAVGASPLDVLTVRECEVLHMVSRGCQNKIIAAELDLAENTVKIHLHNIIRKLAVSNRTQAAALYLEEIEAGRAGGNISSFYDNRHRS